MVVGGGRALSLGGCFFQPSVLVGANTDMQLAHEETFGPVAPIIRWESCYRDTAEEVRGWEKYPLYSLSLYPSCRFETEEEAIAVANATPFGLAGQVLN